MQPKDIHALVNVSSPKVSPDGRLVAFVVTRIDEPENTYRSQVWLAATDGSTPPEPFSSGEHGDANPCWSPDGRRLAFTSKRKDKHSTLHVRPVAGGGETVTLASLPEGMGALAWSPDGRWLAFGARARTGQYDSDDERRQPPRRVTRFFSRLNDEGWVMDRPQHVWVVPVDGSAAPRDLTPGEFAFETPSWSPDSTRLVVSGAAHDTWDTDLASDLYTVGLDGAPPQALTKGGMMVLLPSWSPDGSAIAFLGVDNPLTEPQNAKVGLLDVETGGRRWVSRFDRTHAPYPGAVAPIWDGDGVLVVVEDRGNVHLRRVPVADHDEAAETTVLDGEAQLTGVDLAGGTLAFTATSATQLAEVYAVARGEQGDFMTTVFDDPPLHYHGDGVPLRRLTRVGDAVAELVRPLPYERFTATSTGGAEVDAWIVTPPDHHEGGSYPALLMIHGGPHTQYGNRFFDEAQLYASAGYVVLMSNPRGSSGRETAWGRAIVGPKDRWDPGTGWGTVDYDDVMAVVDSALERYPFIDGERLGVMGGSYGGYMTSWIVGHTDRFKAACSERAVNNMMTLEWSSDIATAFRTELGVTHLEDPTEYLARSPISYVQRIRTPLLIIHSEQDLRCPIEQAEQLWVALRMLGREVEFVRFPGESHELTRSGSPIHRVQRAEIILEFFAKHLQPAEDLTSDDAEALGLS